jgi:hypothetical protein
VRPKNGERHLAPLFGDFTGQAPRFLTTWKTGLSSGFIKHFMGKSPTNGVLNGNHIFKMLGFQPCLKTPEPDPGLVFVAGCIAGCGVAVAILEVLPDAKWGLRLKVMKILGILF